MKFFSRVTNDPIMILTAVFLCVFALFTGACAANPDNTLNDITKSGITATIDKNPICLGEIFEINGTNDVGDSVFFFIKGTNYPLSIIRNYSWNPLTVSGNVWNTTVDASLLQSSAGNYPDEGTYTIYVAALNDGISPEKIIETTDFDNKSKVRAYTDVSLSLIRPFLNAEISSAVVAQGNKLEINGKATGGIATVRLYVFGTNYFNGADISVRDDGTFSWSKKINAPDVGSEELGDWSMATGQYFAVVQHPMNNKYFNIAPQKPNSEHHTYDEPCFNMGADICIFYDRATGYTLFNTAEFPSMDANQALINAINDPNIDDNEVHFKFEVVAKPTSQVNEVTSTVIKGDTLTLSGITVGLQNEVVTAELHTSESKEETDDHSFSSIKTTRIGEDGVWTLSFDTSTMKTDQYTVSITVGQFDPVTAQVTIVDRSIQPEYVVGTLYPGWNFISFPKKLSAEYDTAAELFADVDTASHPILMYNGDTKEWEQVNASTEIQPLDAYWIYSTKKLELPFTYDSTPSVPSVKKVYEGWNAVGLSANDDTPAKIVFGNTNWYSYIPWDGYSQHYLTPVVKGFSDDMLVGLGVGGWIFVNNDGWYSGLTA